MQGWNPSLISEQNRNKSENSLLASKDNKEIALYHKKCPKSKAKG